MPSPSVSSPLPIDAVLNNLDTALARHTGVVLQAPPGAGKTTRVPLALMDSTWLEGKKILMLEPRRLAARAAAFRMADTLGQRVGHTVGYRVRMDSRVGPGTRIEVVTEGVLTRMLQSDPALEGVGLVVFDEFHERSLEADLGLALCLDLQGVLNENLRILIMSATMDTGPIADLLGDAAKITCKGRTFPVETRYQGTRRTRTTEHAVSQAVCKAAASEDGSILVFLPGAAEIKRVERLLKECALGPQWRIQPLFGNLTQVQQDQAIAPPPPGKRKIVLATSIAETSLTIEGIRVVIDSGLMRVPRFDVRSGMTRLETLTVSRASADQRRGRAGRVCPGICYRMWTPETHRTLAACNRPEILEGDMVPLALQLAVWGLSDPGQLNWLDPPPEAAFSQAQQLLKQLDLLDGNAKITPHGRKAAALPLHPRLAHMALKARAANLGTAACDLAALVSERDILRFSPGEQDADLALRMDIVQKLRHGGQPSHGSATLDRSAGRRAIQVADNLRQRLKISPESAPPAAAGRLLAWAYPDRIAQRRPGSLGRFLLANGRGAVFTTPQPLAAEDYLIAARLDGNRQNARIFLAAAYDKPTLEDQYASRLRQVESVTWDLQRKMVTATKTLHLGALTTHSEIWRQPSPDKVLAALIAGIRQQGIGCLPWTRSTRRFQVRVQFVARIFDKQEKWPDVSDQGLEKRLEKWLAPFLGGMSRLRDLTRVDLRGALAGQLTWHQQQRLDRLAPTHWTVPSGSRIPIDYSGNPPVLAVRLQELFGLTKTPTVADGRQPLLIHLLSPAGRPTQVTQDLAGFWESGYLEVKKEMKGRYPKHYWPDNPLAATPTNRAKPRKVKRDGG